MLVRLDSCFRRNDEGLSAAMEPKFWDFAENDAVILHYATPSGLGTQRESENWEEFNADRRSQIFYCEAKMFSGN